MIDNGSVKAFGQLPGVPGQFGWAAVAASAQRSNPWVPNTNLLRGNIQVLRQSVMVRHPVPTVFYFTHMRGDLPQLVVTNAPRPGNWWECGASPPDKLLSRCNLVGNSPPGRLFVDITNDPINRSSPTATFARRTRRRCNEKEEAVRIRLLAISILEAGADRCKASLPNVPMAGARHFPGSCARSER